MKHNKDFYRKIKRVLKKEGNKKKRQWLKHQLDVNPDEAPHNEYDFGVLSSEWLNGLDHDATRKKQPPIRSQQDPLMGKYWTDEEGII